MPPQSPRHQLKATDIQAVDEELFDSKVLRLAVENSDAAAVSARRLRLCHPKAARFPCVNSFYELRLLENSTIYPSLCHPIKCRLQTPVLSVPDAECAEPDYFILPSYDPRPSLLHPYIKTHIPYHRKIFSLSPSARLPSPPT